MFGQGLANCLGEVATGLEQHWCRAGDKASCLTPADVYSGRGSTILAERERIKRQTIANRRLQHQLQAA